MSRNLFSFFVFLALLATVGSPARAGEQLPKPDILTEEKILTETRLGNYDTLIIKDFSSDKAEYSRVDEEERARIETMKPLLVNAFAESLIMNLKNLKLFKKLVRNEAPKGKALIMEGEFTEYNAGSRALKFWVGFGAGKAYIRVKGRLLDAETGKELALFEDRETGYRGAVGMESYEDLFPHQAKSLGENIAKFIEKLY